MTPRSNVSLGVLVAALLFLGSCDSKTPGVSNSSGQNPIGQNSGGQNSGGQESGGQEPGDPAAETPASRSHPSGYSARARQILADGPLRGVVLGLYSQDPTYDYRYLLDEIRDLGCSWVSITVNHYQRHNDSIEVNIPDARSAPWERVRTTLKQARERNLHVLLFPILLLSEPDENDWRGTIKPSDRPAWYRSYGTLMKRYAELAEAEGVDMLSVGSEFNSMEGDTEPWKTMIREIRSRYDGALTYSVNWDSLDGPAFYDEVDVVGMTTYFSLTQKDDPTVAELREAWLPIREDVLTWATHLGRPVIFTEVGFASQDGINKDPWNYFLSETVDLQEQTDCFRAFTDIWRADRGLSGVFFYNWFGLGGPDDKGYTPRGKPALEVIREWFPESRNESATE